MFAFDLNDFTQMKPGAGWGVPSKCIRVNSSLISVSEDIFSTYAPEPDKEGRVHIGLAYSEKHKALLLQNDAQIYFSFTKDKASGVGRLAPLPRAIRLAKVPRGTYMQSQHQPNVFVLYDENFAYEGTLTQTDPHKKYAADVPLIEVGDVVTWFSRGEVRVPGFKTGIVERIVGGGDAEQAAIIEVLTKKWLDAYPGRKNTTVKLNNLIVREKHDNDTN